MKQIGGEEPRRPFYEESEKENPTGAPNKDNISDQPGSGDLMTTGDKPLKDDDALDGDASDGSD